MIAAGSLFTSCIEPIEPAGIYDLREAKARYYDALSKLRAADADLVEAEAEVTRGLLAIEQEIANYLAELVEAERLKNEATAIGNDSLAFKWNLRMQEIEQEHAKTMLDLEAANAKAQIDRDKALSELQMASLDLTQEEKDALSNALKAYTDAYDDWVDAKETYINAYAAYVKAEYEMGNVTDEDGLFFTGFYQTYIQATDEDGNPLIDEYGDPVIIPSYVLPSAWIRTGMDLREYYESGIAFYTLEAAAIAEEMATFEGFPDVEAWAKELADLKEKIDGYKFDRYQVTKDSVEYMMNVYHDGSHAYAMAVQEWVDEHGATPVVEPTEPVAPEAPEAGDPFYKTENEIEIEDPVTGTTIVIPAGEVIGAAEPIEFDPLKKSKVGALVYNKFVYLLTNGNVDPKFPSYFQNSPADPTKKILDATGATGDLVLTADRDMADFVMGTKDAGVIEYTYIDNDDNEQTIEASYGLVGAYETLLRELVTEKDKTAEKIEDAKKLMHEMDSTWTADRAILDAGLAAYKPFTDAISAYETNQEAYDKAVKDDGDDNKAVVDAAKELVDVLNNIVGHASYTYYDSTALVNAIVDFAKARKEYLPYKPYGTPGAPIDSNQFYFYHSNAGDKVFIDSLEFTALTYEKIRDEKRYGWEPKDTSPYYTDLNDGGTVEGAFFNIVRYLLGNTVANHIKTKTAGITLDDLGSAAFYGMYKIKDGKMYTVTPDAVYVDPAVTTAATALNTAKNNVKKAAAKFVAVYNKFWAENVTSSQAAAPYTDKDAMFDTYFAKTNATEKAEALQDAIDEFEIGGTLLPLDHTCYTEDTFMKPYNAVTFTGVNPDATPVLLAILTAVDPACTDRTDNAWFITNGIDKSKIFFGPATDNLTDFYKMMKARYEYAVLTSDTETDLKKVEEWIVKVLAAFVADAVDAAEEMEEWYELDKAAYEEKVETYEEDLAEYKADQAARLEFLGWDEEADNFNPIVTAISAPIKGANPEVSYGATGVVLTEVKVYEYKGEWNLAAGQKKLAEECLPGYPEKLAEWKTKAVQLEHKIKHAEDIYKTLETAYAGALSVERPEDHKDYVDYCTVAGVDPTVEGFYQYLINQAIADLLYDYEMALAMISRYEEMLYLYDQGCDPAQIALQVLKDELDKAEVDLETKAADLEIKKAAYERILDEILNKYN